MATTISGYTEFVAQVDRSVTVVAGATEFISSSLTQVPQQTTLQKVWDTVEGDWVLWETAEIDHDGVYYPGPGSWGAQTSNYRIQNIKFTRS